MIKKDKHFKQIIGLTVEVKSLLAIKSNVESQLLEAQSRVKSQVFQVESSCVELKLKYLRFQSQVKSQVYVESQVLKVKSRVIFQIFQVESSRSSSP